MSRIGKKLISLPSGVTVDVSGNIVKVKGPKGLQSVLEPVVQFIAEEVARPALGKHTEKFLPFLLSAFFFILINLLINIGKNIFFQ